jgi:ubiquitin-protein ligase
MNLAHPLLAVSIQRVVKDIEELVLNRRTSSFTEFKVFSVYREGPNLVIPATFKVIFKDSRYFNAFFEGLIKCSPGFPFKPPEMFIKNRVLHPNIDINTGRVYIKLLDSLSWKSGYSINEIFLAFEEILICPDFEFSALCNVNPEFFGNFFKSLEDFWYFVGKTLDGGVFFGYFFEENYGKNLAAKRIRENIDENTKRVRLNEDLGYFKMRVF